MQCHDRSWGGRLPEGDVGDRAAPAQDADPALPSPREGRHAFHDISPACDLHDVGAEGVGAVPGYDDGRLWLVLGTCWPSPWPPRDLFTSSSSRFFPIGSGGSGGGRGGGVVVTFPFLAVAEAAVVAEVVVLGVLLLLVGLELVMRSKAVEVSAEERKWKRTSMSRHWIHIFFLALLAVSLLRVLKIPLGELLPFSTQEI